jgi:hypothetical protein
MPADDALTRVGSAPAVFEPGPSFNEQPAAADNTELPNWLQTFAQHVEADEPAPFDAPVAAPPADVAPELPSWLTAARAEVEPSGAAPLDLSGGDEVGFITEDDLPEWLRSINESDAPAGAAPAAHATHAAVAVATLQAPSVVSAWTGARQVTGLAVGETLFADIAGEEGHAATADARDDASAAPALSLAAPTALAEPAAAAAAHATSNRSRRYLLYALVFLALLALLFFLTR